jgi:hypothetical protein
MLEGSRKPSRIRSFWRSTRDNHITADSLDVWNVSIPIDRDTNIEERVKDLRLHEENPLWPLERLLKTFIVDLDEKTLHVVVKAPPIREHRYLFLSVIPLIQIIVR